MVMACFSSASPLQWTTTPHQLLILGHGGRPRFACEYMDAHSIEVHKFSQEGNLSPSLDPTWEIACADVSKKPSRVSLQEEFPPKKVSECGDATSLEDPTTENPNFDLQLDPDTTFSTMASLLKHFGQAKALSKGRHVHAHIKKYGHGWNTFIVNCVIDMYGACGCVVEAQAVFDELPCPNVYSWNILINVYVQNGNLCAARSVFDRMPERDVVSWSAIIKACAQHGHAKDALNLFKQMQLEDIKPNEITFVCAIYACANISALQEGQDIHAAIIESGCEFNSIVRSALITMYGKCRAMDAAESVLGRMANLSAETWTAMVAACAQNGDACKALDLFHDMQLEHAKLDEFTFISTIHACAMLGSIDEGWKIHTAAVHRGLDQNIFIGNALVHMYGNCDSLDSARSVFGVMPLKDVVSWSAMIAACTLNGNGTEALELFQQMELDDVTPDKVTFVTVLDACASITALEEGKKIHAIILACGYEQDVMVGNSLVDLYGKCGSLDEARRMFCRITCWDTISWNILITAYARGGDNIEALEVYACMQLEGILPNLTTFICVLDACASTPFLDKGKEIHAAIADTMYESLTLDNALINMYGKCGSLNEARNVFGRMFQKDAISWNTMIAACIQNAHIKEALYLFSQMQFEGAKPTTITFICILDAVASRASIADGEDIHAAIIENGYADDVSVRNALVMMYGRCESVETARILFVAMHQRDMVSWNSMIATCAQNGQLEEAQNLLEQMNEDGIMPNNVTFVCVLEAYASQAVLEKGRGIHAAIIHSGYNLDVFVGNATINMYGKCGSVDQARVFFETMPHRNVVSWSAIISAYAQNDLGKDALKFYNHMLQEGVKPDKVTFICVLDVCASLLAVKEGKAIHAAIIDSGYEPDVVVGNTLISMYGKCSSLDDARSVFGRMPERNVIGWTAMIAACAQNGNDKQALEVYERMQLEGVQPNHVTFTCVLNACSHTGQVDKARHYFLSMKRDYGLQFMEEHYVCMIDLLGRAGHLKEAEEIISNMPVKNATVAWLSLLGSCRTHGDLERGVHAADRCFELDPENVAARVMLTNILAAAGKWGESVKAREALMCAPSDKRNDVQRSS